MRVHPLGRLIIASCGGSKLIRILLVDYHYRSRQSEGDHLIIINERHLQLVLKEYAAHYNQGRPHRSLGLVPPNGPPVRVVAPDRGRVKAHPVLGGLHHEYQWEAA